MKLFGFDFEIRRQQKAFEGDVDTILRRLHAFYDTVSGINVTPESCMQAPTVQAIVQGVSRRIASMPIQVLRKSESRGRMKKEPLPNHSVAKLLQAPNNWQTSRNFWLDATSVLVRYQNFYSYKAQGKTGPIRALRPIHPNDCKPEQDDETYDVQYRVSVSGGQQQVLPFWAIMHARGMARDFLEGDSPVRDVREAIALEIAAEKFGASFFGNGALPTRTRSSSSSRTPSPRGDSSERSLCRPAWT
jgi:HK97 family phage portal protein